MGDVLTWKEFAFVQSKLGWLCLCFGTAHDLFMGFRYIFIEPPILCGFFFTATTYAFWIPGLTIALKLPLIIPPIDWYLTKIRGGWTRNQKSSDSSEIFGMDNLGMDQPKIKGSPSTCQTSRASKNREWPNEN